MYEIDEKCQTCKNNGTAICNRCDMYYDEFEPIDRTPQTNYDRIRAMSVEEMSRWIWAVQSGIKNEDIVSTTGWLDWLKQEVSEE